MTASGACPKCSFPAPPGAVECPACGVVYARFRGAAPRTPEPAPDGVWRDGDVLVMRREARLPGRCVRCAVPTELRVKKVLVWHGPGWYLLARIHPLLYLPVAMLVVKRVELQVPLCAFHRRRRRVLIATGCALMAAGAGLFALIFLLRLHPGLLLVAVVAFLTGAGFAVVATTGLVVARRIDAERVWLEKVCSGYLDRLPPAPADLPAAPAPGRHRAKLGRFEPPAATDGRA